MALKKHHWFPFYYLDWLSDSALVMMTYSEKGLYMDMLARCYNEDGLPSDNKKLMRLFKCDQDDLDECVKMFYKKDEKLLNKKLDEIKKEQQNVSKVKSRAGKASAEARKNKRLIESTGVEQVLNSVETEHQQNPTNREEKRRVSNNTIDKEKSKPKKQANIIPPKLEWIEDYCKEKGKNIDCGKFFNYYESNGWKVGKNKMKSWPAALSNWGKNNFDSSQPTFQRYEPANAAPLPIPTMVQPIGDLWK